MARPRSLADAERALEDADALVRSSDATPEELERAARRARQAFGVAAEAGDDELAGALALVEGQALAGLGDAAAALPRLEEALRRLPGDLEVLVERGQALHELCRFQEAAQALDEALRADPDDPWALHAAGLAAERLGRARDAERMLARARKLAPEEFPSPVTLSPDAFEAVVEAALERLPEPVRRYLSNVVITVEDLPGEDELRGSDPPLSPSILGIFRGAAFPHKASMDPWSHFPSSIALFQRNLERYARDPEELAREIEVTLLHEVGHFLGLDEEDLRVRGLD
jgi:predicted Zn-dependent protease with MMP-like domain/Flp pilus assembly protein TadD